MSDSERAAWRKGLADKHLTAEELAERESVAIWTVYGWNKRGTGPRYMKIGGQARYRVADVIAWENSREVGGQVTA